MADVIDDESMPTGPEEPSTDTGPALPVDDENVPTEPHDTPEPFVALVEDDSEANMRAFLNAHAGEMRRLHDTLFAVEAKRGAVGEGKATKAAASSGSDALSTKRRQLNSQLKQLDEAAEKRDKKGEPAPLAVAESEEITKDVVDKVKADLAAATKENQALQRRVSVRLDAAQALQSIDDEILGLDRRLGELGRTKGMLEALVQTKQRCLVPSEGMQEMVALAEQYEKDVADLRRRAQVAGMTRLRLRRELKTATDKVEVNRELIALASLVAPPPPGGQRSGRTHSSGRAVHGRPRGPHRAAPAIASNSATAPPGSRTPAPPTSFPGLFASLPATKLALNPPAVLRISMGRDAPVAPTHPELDQVDRFGESLAELFAHLVRGHAAARRDLDQVTANLTAVTGDVHAETAAYDRALRAKNTSDRRRTTRHKSPAKPAGDWNIKHDHAANGMFPPPPPVPGHEPAVRPLQLEGPPPRPKPPNSGHPPPVIRRRAPKDGAPPEAAKSGNPSGASSMPGTPRRGAGPAVGAGANAARSKPKCADSEKAVAAAAKDAAPPADAAASPANATPAPPDAADAAVTPADAATPREAAGVPAPAVPAADGGATEASAIAVLHAPTGADGAGAAVPPAPSTSELATALAAAPAMAAAVDPAQPAGADEAAPALQSAAAGESATARAELRVAAHAVVT
mmetsp:Transcript_26532/g.78059  ORF Transcript_26532/g.78059 Transcript_26532/m.78059 type:complete len:687 (+) Transcript_26532:118-2178(+)|eukprot:CAMPEP_0206046930 /NCGR_PEP_ID=MMETSP1466-20131121/19889_1 /ASSEMBLY_ACC=CAM_ASM_001126 /TAXON_ID=44452 /ORGANISM="Pavlova gyrans, Strain CCMP608" /LENGTH=686 /DNA_ID=CAMNT_0053421929 /DNA_START=31 /DNA_END=2091 /DNA_ORIENTATION=+